MYLNAVIKQLRQECKWLKNKVGGVYEWTDNASIQDMSFNALPALYVIPNDDDIGENERLDSGYYQKITSNFSLLLFMPKGADEKVADYNALEKAKRSIYRSLCGFHPCNTYDRLTYTGGGGVEACTRAFICIKMEFSYDEVLRSDVDNQENVYVDTIKLPTFKGIDATLEAESIKTKIPINMKAENDDDSYQNKTD